jgi:magnesium-transporting ATPase (P-type)
MEVGIPCQDIIRKKEDRVEVFIPFNSARKRACTAINHPDLPNTVRVFVKGAPEMVIELCDQYFDVNGEAQELGHTKKEYILNSIIRDTFAVKAYRTLLIAYTDMPLSEYEHLKAGNNNF